MFANSLSLEMFEKVRKVFRVTYTINREKTLLNISFQYMTHETVYSVGEHIKKFCLTFGLCFNEKDGIIKFEFPIANIVGAEFPGFEDEE